MEASTVQANGGVARKNERVKFVVLGKVFKTLLLEFSEHSVVKKLHGTSLPHLNSIICSFSVPISYFTTFFERHSLQKLVELAE
jgi:hypothetical protein